MDDTDVYEDYYVFVFESEIEDQNQIEALGITRVFSQPHNANKIILYVDDDGKLYYRLDTSGDGTLSSDA